MGDVKEFFNNFYAPDNCILVVAGNIDLEKTQALCKKWFEPIAAKNTVKAIYEAEPTQSKARHKANPKVTRFPGLHDPSLSSSAYLSASLRWRLAKQD